MTSFFSSPTTDRAEAVAHPAAPRFTLDHCLYFDHPTSPGGRLYVQGWMYRAGAETPLDLTVDTGREEPVVIPCDMPRPDVAACHGEGGYSGFQAAIPVRAAPKKPIALNAHLDGRQIQVAQPKAYNVDRLMKKGRQLSPIRQRKLANLILNEKERINGVTDLRSKPLYLLVDPSSNCQLACGSCHGNMAREQGWRPPNMTLAAAREIFQAYGDTLIQAHLFNWGEPFLHKDFHKFVEEAKKYDLWTSTSSNLSLKMSVARVDAIISAGLDHLIMGVDGATQEVYERYRKNGRLELVMENVRLFVERKKALGSKTPHLQYQHLDFPWSRHEIPAARALAQSIGVDEFYVKGGCIHGTVPMPTYPQVNPDGQVPMREPLRAHLKGIKEDLEGKHRYFGCDHLYHQLSINSDGSVHPCCYVYEARHSVANVNDTPAGEIFNNAPMQQARTLLRDLDKGPVAGQDPCANCWIVGDDEAKGHKMSSLTFLHGLALLFETPIHAVFDQPAGFQIPLLHRWI